MSEFEPSEEDWESFFEWVKSTESEETDEER